MKFLTVFAIATGLFLVNWAITSLIVFLGLNFIGDFGFNFAQIIGIGYLLAFVKPVAEANFNN